MPQKLVCSWNDTVYHGKFFFFPITYLYICECVCDNILRTIFWGGEGAFQGNTLLEILPRTSKTTLRIQSSYLSI